MSLRSNSFKQRLIIAPLSVLALSASTLMLAGPAAADGELVAPELSSAITSVEGEVEVLNLSNLVVTEEDSDGDGLSDEDEAAYGTDALNPDSDGDLAIDGTEVMSETDPLDALSFLPEDVTPEDVMPEVDEEGVVVLPPLTPEAPDTPASDGESTPGNSGKKSSAPRSSVGSSAAVKMAPKLDKNCGDFKSQSDAQAYFGNNGGGSSNNFDGLDRDGDGEACEGIDYTGSSVGSGMDKSDANDNDGSAGKGVFVKGGNDKAAPSYENCTAVYNAGESSLLRSNPSSGYNSDLDNDGDGVACEDDSAANDEELPHAGGPLLGLSLGGLLMSGAGAGLFGRRRLRG